VQAAARQTDEGVKSSISPEMEEKSIQEGQKESAQIPCPAMVLDGLDSKDSSSRLN
jgi:hypothetical protein